MLRKLASVMVGRQRPDSAANRGKDRKNSRFRLFSDRKRPYKSSLQLIFMAIIVAYLQPDGQWRLI
jgi:hypothetical protein